MRPALKLCGVLGFVGGFLLAYQTSSSRFIYFYYLEDLSCPVRFLGLIENGREYQKDLEELTKRAQEGKPLYGESSQPEWIQGAAHRNSAFSQFKFAAFPMYVSLYILSLIQLLGSILSIIHTMVQTRPSMVLNQRRNRINYK